jgi:hypothetical protein
MGMSSHFYIADDEAGTDHARAQNSAADDRATYAGITPLELSTLWALVEKAEWDVKMMRVFPIVVAVNVGERIVHEIPTEVIERLATLSMDEIARVAQGWASTLEMAPRAEEVSGILMELVRLATRSRATHRRLFLANRFERR